MPLRDKRPVDELSIEELERILAIRRREARQMQMERMRKAGRVIDPVPPALLPVVDISDENQGQVHEIALPAATPAPAPAGVPKPRTAAPGNGLPQFEDGDEIVAVRGNGARGEVYQVVAAEPRGAQTRRRLIDRLLLLIEVAAVIGIVVIGANLLGAVQLLERETAEAQAAAEEQRRQSIPTLAPTPTLRLENFVLPGGHIVQDGLPVFNYSEVPAHLQPLVQSQWIQPVVSRPAPTSETALALLIPKLNINQPIVQGVDWAALQQGVGQLVNGADPGDAIGNVVLAAHNDIYGQIFRYLDQMEVGDQFQIQTQTQIYTYTVTELRFVNPDQVEVLQERGGPTATLISCWPYQVNTQRVVVFADRVT